MLSPDYHGSIDWYGNKRVREADVRVTLLLTRSMWLQPTTDHIFSQCSHKCKWFRIVWDGSSRGTGSNGLRYDILSRNGVFDDNSCNTVCISVNETVSYTMALLLHTGSQSYSWEWELTCVRDYWLESIKVCCMNGTCHQAKMMCSAKRHLS